MNMYVNYYIFIIFSWNLSYEIIELIIMTFNCRVSCRIFWSLLQWIMSISFIWNVLSSSVCLWYNGVSSYNRMFSKGKYRFAYKGVGWNTRILILCVLRTPCWIVPTFRYKLMWWKLCIFKLVGKCSVVLLNTCLSKEILFIPNMSKNIIFLRYSLIVFFPNNRNNQANIRFKKCL